MERGKLIAVILIISLMLAGFIGYRTYRNSLDIHNVAQEIIRLTYEHNNLHELSDNNVKLSEYMRNDLFHESFDINNEIVMVTRYFQFEGGKVNIDILDYAKRPANKGGELVIVVYKINSTKKASTHRTAIMGFASNGKMRSFKEITN